MFRVPSVGPGADSLEPVSPDPAQMRQCRAEAVAIIAASFNVLVDVRGKRAWFIERPKSQWSFILGANEQTC